MAATSSTARHPLEPFHGLHRESNGHRNSSEANVGIPFHGSCSRCHHFHTNHLFTFPLDSTAHTRLSCERCNHPMFGLGRVSTQNTLASVESDYTFTPGVCVDRPGLQPASQAEALPGTSGLGPLTTITERRSPAISRSTSHISTPVPTLTASLIDEEPVESRVPSKDTAHGNSDEQASHLQTTTLRRLRTIARRFKQRFYAKPREWKLRRIGLHITLESPHNAADPSTLPLVASIPSDAHRTGLTGDVSASASASTTEVSSTQRRSDNVAERVSGIEDDTEDRHASLRAQRRELTLAREGEVSSLPKCECSPECPCMNGSRVVQFDRAETPENIHVPGYLFPHHHSSTGSSNSQPSRSSTQGLDLLHIGGHFDTTRRSSSADESSSAAESGPRRIRLSQGSTLWSNGSSSSLRASRRPLIGRASSMPVGTRAHYLAGVRNGSHSNSSMPITGWHETARAPNLLDEGSMPGRTSHTEWSRNGEVSSHESSTSLANLPDPQAEEQFGDGVSPASHTIRRNGGRLTPTPHSGIRLDRDSHQVLPTGSDELSSALQDLANGEMTDHEVHSPENLANDRSD